MISSNDGFKLSRETETKPLLRASYLKKAEEPPVSITTSKDIENPSGVVSLGKILEPHTTSLYPMENIVRIIELEVRHKATIDKPITNVTRPVISVWVAEEESLVDEIRKMIEDEIQDLNKSIKDLRKEVAKAITIATSRAQPTMDSVVTFISAEETEKALDYLWDLGVDYQPIGYQSLIVGDDVLHALEPANFKYEVKPAKDVIERESLSAPRFWGKESLKR